MWTTRTTREMIIAVNEAREVLGLPSLVMYTEEQLEPSTVGQWKIDEVVPQSKGRGTKAIAGVLRFTGDEIVFAGLSAFRACASRTRQWSPFLCLRVQLPCLPSRLGASRCVGVDVTCRVSRIGARRRPLAYRRARRSRRRTGAL